MTQQERLLYLIKYFLSESREYDGVQLPGTEQEQKTLLRSLMNVRPPKPITDDFLKIQDCYLMEETEKKGVIPISELSPASKGIYLWQGDITRLGADAIVNAANSALLGCFIPCHRCIDNCIHSAAGIQLRLACHKLMEEQGREEATGSAKITEAYNLPCRYVLHTVGPIVHGGLTGEHCRLLASCYRSCLELAAAHGLKSIVFNCISTGEFHFPNEAAAQIAVDTVRDFQQKTHSEMEVVFDVFKDADYEIYKKLL